MLAGVGTLLVGPHLGSGSLATDYQTISKNYAETGIAGDETFNLSRDFERDSALLEQQTKARAAQFTAANADTRDKAQKTARELKKKQWVIPLVGYRLTARFGQRSSLWSTFHTGLDFAAPTGTSIGAIAAGTVVSTDYESSYGNKTVIRLEDGTEIWYCHQSRIIVTPGDVVAPGQQIGFVGSTGNVTGAHLHLEVHPGGGDPIDPYPELLAHNVTP